MFGYFSSKAWKFLAFFDFLEILKSCLNDVTIYIKLWKMCLCT